ncbi:MAG: hypothetical protein ACO1OT_09685 [Heyndrickxia sp.]
MSVFKENREVIEAKGSISFWRIASHIGVHENTARNWFKSKMNPERKKLVLRAIKDIKQQELKEAN